MNPPLLRARFFAAIGAALMALALTALPALAVTPSAANGADSVEAASPATGSSAADLESIIELAVADYQKGLDTPDRGARLELFRRAERLFDKAISAAQRDDQPISADLWVNRGNAALQAERLGTATLSYRRALTVDPNHARARKNLRHVRALMPAWVRPPETTSVVDTFFFWHQSWSTAERAFASGLAFLLGGVLLALSIRTGRSSFRTAAFFPLIAWAGLATSVVIDQVADATPEAVFVSPETVGRSADSDHVAPRFPDPIPGGTEATILERRSPWVHVELSTGRDAWVPETAIEPL
ncbi:MAG: hypothetical protein AAF488_08300 [Planctomycetota bacterium]